MKSIKGIFMLMAAGIFAISATVKYAADIVDVAAGSKDHTTLVAAVKAAGLVETLRAPDHLRFLLPPMMHLQNCLPVLLKLY